MRAVGVALVLADVLGQPRGEGAAEDAVGELGGGVALVGTPHRAAAQAEVGLHGAGTVDEQQGHVRHVGHRRHLGAGAVGLPAPEGLLDLVEGARRRQVADEHEKAAAGDDATPVQGPQRARRHLGDLVGRRQRSAVRVVAVPAVQPRLVGHHPRLRQRAAQVVAQPAGLPLGGRARVRRVGEHLGQQAEQASELRLERLATEGEAVGAVVDAQPAAQALQGLGQLALRAAARAEHHRPREHGRLGQVGVAADGVGHPQPQVDQRHARPPDGDDPEPARQRPLGDRGAAVACGAW